MSEWEKNRKKKRGEREKGGGGRKGGMKKGREYVLGMKERALEKACHFSLKKKKEKNKNYERTKEFKQYD